MGKKNPVSLQSAIWWRNNFFGIRGRDEHHKLRWGDLTIEVDVDGRRYILYRERDTKTRKDPGDERAFPPRLYETPGSPDTCPVELLLEYTHRRPLDMCKPDSPFYVQPNKFYQTSKSGVWYKCQRMGEHSLEKIMKEMAKEGGLPGRKTNHSGRKTTVKRLREASIDPVDVMQLTGHKNVQSLNHYSSVTEKKQRQMSDILVKAGKTDEEMPSTSNKDNNNDEDFPDDLDADALLKSIENYECQPIRGNNLSTNSGSETSEFVLSTQSLGLSNPWHI